MSSKFVYFDLGNVLVHFDHARAFENLAEITGKSPEQVKQVAFGSEIQTRYETGLISSHEYAQEINDKLHTSLTEEAVLKAISDIFTPNDSILEALQLVQSAKVPTAILSNTCVAHWGWLLNKNWPMLDGWFQHAILSFEVLSMKPDAGIYEVSEKRANRMPRDLFFTDDRADNIAAAQQRGWATHQFTSTDNLLPALKRWFEADA